MAKTAENVDKHAAELRSELLAATSFYSADYFEARERFLAASAERELEHHSLTIHAPSPRPEPLTIDVTIAGMNDNKTRQAKINFVDYFNSGITIMVQKGNPTSIKSSDDLCGKSIAVVTGTSQEDFAAGQSATCTKAGKEALKVTATDSDAQNQTQLRTGRVAAIINDLPSAVYISRTAGGGKYFQVVDQPPVNGAPYGIGMLLLSTGVSTGTAASGVVCVC